MPSPVPIQDRHFSGYLGVASSTVDPDEVRWAREAEFAEWRKRSHDLNRRKFWNDLMWNLIAYAFLIFLAFGVHFIKGCR
jgi:hypothetical protein